MTDRSHHGEAPGPEGVDPDGGWAVARDVDETTDAEPSTEGLRPDGGDPPGGLFAATTDPGLRYELNGGPPVVTDANTAYRERFELAGDVTGPLEERLRTDLERAESAAGFARIDDVVDLVESAADETRTRTVVRADADGGERGYLASVVPAGEHDGDEDPEGGRAFDGYLLLTDVSPLLERTRDIAEERDRLDDFASIVSHDLRNPLEVAKIQLEVARERGDEVHFEKIEEAHSRMERIIEGVLTLARQGRVIDDVDDVTLSSVATDAWNSVSTPEGSLSVEGDAVLAADQNRLQELLENLFRNATEHAGPDVRVTVRTTEDGFSVADDGPGIPEEDCEAVFENGYSTAPNGTGLGLVIVERIADAHGWSVAAGRAEDGGARFDVSGVDVGE